MIHLTIAYLTSRQEPMFEWFADSLCNECAGDFSGKKLVVVDFYADMPGRRAEFATKLARWPAAQFIHVAPKPSVWQGPHRLTRQDYFAAANARNTALCLAPDGWIAYADDVSVLIPGWLACVQAAQAANYIVLGAYQKVSRLQVDSGRLVSCVDLSTGYDSRLKHLQFDRAIVKAPGSWFFGCSLAAPVEAFLAINGWDDDLNCMGTEDYAAGLMLEAQHYDLRYNPAMMTYESEEHHHLGFTLPRRGKPVKGQLSDGHAYLEMIKGGRNRSPNYFGPDGIAGLRAKILAGEPFPICQIPEHDWRDGQPLRDF